MPAAILEAVLGNLALAAALAAVALAAGRWLKRPTVAHTLWLLVLVKLVTPPLFTVPVRVLPAHEVAEVARVPVPTQLVTLPAPSIATTIVTPPAPQVILPVVAPVAAPVVNAAPLPAVPISETRWLPAWETVLLAAWAVGTLVYMAVAAKRVRRFGKLLAFSAPAPSELTADVASMAARMGLRRSPRVRVVPGGIAPLVWAVGRPTLYFPAGLLKRLSPEQCLTLLAHELAHLRRWDHVVRAIEFVAVAVYWWCPLAWVARRELRRLEEEACDGEVTATVPDSGYAFASAIVETIDYVAGVPAAPKFASGIGDVRSLRRRLVLILEGRNTPRTPARVRMVLVLGGVALLAVGPKLDRLTAAARDTRIESAEKFTSRTTFAPRPGDEAFAEAVQFLPTPSPLLTPADVGTFPASAAALSPDGLRLAIASGAVVRVWELGTKRLLCELSGHADVVNAVAFSPDGSRLATASNDGKAIVWDAADGRKLHTLAGHTQWVMAVVFSPDSRTLATGSYDKTVRLWDVASGAAKAKWKGHLGGVRAVAFSPDGRTLATAGADHDVRLWDVASGHVWQTLKKHHASVRAVAFSPDGTLLASGSEDRTVRIWHVADEREAGTGSVLPDDVASLKFSPRGEALFAGTGGGHLIQLNPTTGKVRAYVGVEPGRPADSPAHTAALTAILTPPDGRTLITVSQDRTVLAWPSAGRLESPQQTFSGGHRTTAVALSPDGVTLATGGHDGVIRIWDAATAAELRSMPAHPGGVTSLVFGAGGRLVSTGADERVRVWEATSGQALLSLIQPTADLHVALSPDGKTLAIGGRKLPGVTLLNLTTRGKPRRVGGFAGDATAVAFTPSGDRLATGYSTGMVRFWDATSGGELARSSPRNGSVGGIAFTPDGATALVVLNGEIAPDSDDPPVHEAIVVDTRTGLVRAGTLAHPAPVTSAAVTQDGRVLTAAHDGNLYLWNPDAGCVARVIRGHADTVRGVALAADGSAVYSAGDRAAKQWPLLDPSTQK